MSCVQTTTYLTSWDIESPSHNLLVLRGGLMLSHGILQAPHGLNVSLVHKLPHLQHLTGPGVQMRVLQSRVQNKILDKVSMSLVWPESSQELHDAIVIAHVPTALCNIDQIGEHLSLLFHGSCCQNQPGYPWAHLWTQTFINDDNCKIQV